MTKIFEGQTCIGLTKPLRSGGLEVFDVTGAYLAKAANEAEAARVVIAARGSATSLAHKISQGRAAA
jgi:hypothetical protein